MRQCIVRTERFESDKQALQRQINDLSITPENRRWFSDAATSLSQTLHEISSLKQPIKLKNLTIGQLKEYVKTLKDQVTPGPVARASLQVDSEDPRSWPLIYSNRMQYYQDLMQSD